MINNRKRLYNAAILTVVGLALLFYFTYLVVLVTFRPNGYHHNVSCLELNEVLKNGRNIEYNEAVDFVGSTDYTDYLLANSEQSPYEQTNEKETTKAIFQQETNGKTEKMTVNLVRVKRAVLRSYLRVSADDVMSDAATDAQNKDSATRYEFGLPMIGAILLFIANFLFYMFTILIMWSYGQELRWADYFYDIDS